MLCPRRESPMKALTAAEMREVDRLTTERHGIPGPQLMEEAGKHVSNVVRLKLDGNPNKRVVFLCGKGNKRGYLDFTSQHLTAEHQSHLLHLLRLQHKHDNESIATVISFSAKEDHAFIWISDLKST